MSCYYMIQYNQCKMTPFLSYLLACVDNKTLEANVCVLWAQCLKAHVADLTARANVERFQVAAILEQLDNARVANLWAIGQSDVFEFATLFDELNEAEIRTRHSAINTTKVINKKWRGYITHVLMLGECIWWLPQIKKRTFWTKLFNDRKKLPYLTWRN